MAVTLQLQTTESDDSLWNHLPDLRLTNADLQRLTIESCLLYHYLKDLSSTPGASDISSAEKAIEKLADDGCMSLQTHSRAEEILKICQNSKAVSDKKYWAGSYNNFVWLVFKVMGCSYALLVGCAFKKREFRLNRSQQASLLSFLIRTKPLDGPPATERQRGVSSSTERRLTPSSERRPSPSSERRPSPPSLPVEIHHAAFLPYERMRRAFRFLCALGPAAISEVFLMRIQEYSEIWSSAGEVQAVRAPRIDPVLDDLTSGECIDFLRVYKELGIVSATVGGFRREEYKIDPAVGKVLGNEPCIPDLEWVVVVAICHAFPGRWEDIWFNDTGRLLLPLVQHAFRQCSDLPAKVVQQPQHGYKVLLTLLLSTHLPGTAWKSEALDKAEDVLSCRPGFADEDTAYLRGLVQMRKRELSRRLQGVQWSRTEPLLESIDARTYCLNVAWQRSEAQDRIMLDTPDLDGAERILQELSANNFGSSTMGELESKQVGFLAAKVHRWQGKFSQSEKGLRRLIDNFAYQYNEMGCSVWSHYVAVLCELHRFTKAECLARHALDGLLEHTKDGIHAERKRRHRMLRLLVAETLVCRCLSETDFDSREAALRESETMYAALLEEYRNLTKRDWVSRFEELRVYLGRALLASLMGWLDEANARWEATRSPARYCEQHGKVTGFVEMLIEYSLSIIAAERGDMNKAHHHLPNAKALYRQIGREHWWTCLGTVLLDRYAQILERFDVLSGIEPFCPPSETASGGQPVSSQYEGNQ